MAGATAGAGDGVHSSADFEKKLRFESDLEKHLKRQLQYELRKHLR
jgi:hypothetical protein